MIQATRLTKRYGDTTAVDGLTFTVESGKVTGFLGPNGAGKSTTLRMILGLNTPTSGSVALARSNRIPAARVDQVLLEVGLAKAADRRIGGFSLGMKQRLGIAGALLGDPPVLLFDEPLSGLDPEGVLWVRGLFRRLAAEGRAVFVSSHMMAEVEHTADRIVVVGQGRLIADQSLREFSARSAAASVTVHTPDLAALTAVRRRDI